MKNFSAKILSMLLLLMPLSSFSSDRAFETNAKNYHEKLMLGEFEELEKDAEYARVTNATISDGQPLLAAIYGGTAGCESYSCHFLTTLIEWSEKERMLKQWLSEHPNSITAQISYAAHYTQLGWFHRGGNYSNRVSEESWKLFKDNVEISRVLLAELPAKTKADAGWHLAMTEVAMFQGWPEDEFDQIYTEATNLHPTYIPVYFLKSSYMGPKWHGSLEKFNSYVDNVVEKTRPILGTQMYARLHWSGSRGDIFQSGRTDWVKMKQGFEELVANHPDPWNINNYAKFSCVARDFTKLSELAADVEQNPLMRAWFNNEGFYSYCVQTAKNK